MWMGGLLDICGCDCVAYFGRKEGVRRRGCLEVGKAGGKDERARGSVMELICFVHLEGKGGGISRELDALL